MEVDLNIRSNGSTFFLPTRLDLTVAEFKGLLSTNYGVDAAEDHLLIRNGQFFEDHQPLSYYGLEGGHTVHILPVDGGPRYTGGSSSYTNIDSAFRGTVGLPGFEEVHRLLAQNPNMIRDPLYPHIVEIILHFPQIRRQIMGNTPKHEVADQIDRAACVFANPRIRRQALKAVGNPWFMHQFTRNMISEMRNAGVDMLY